MYRRVWKAVGIRMKEAEWKKQKEKEKKKKETKKKKDNGGK